MGLSLMVEEIALLAFAASCGAPLLTAADRDCGGRHHEQPSLMPMVAAFDGYVETLGKVPLPLLICPTDLIVSYHKTYQFGSRSGVAVIRWIERSAPSNSCSRSRRKPTVALSRP